MSGTHIDGLWPGPVVDGVQTYYGPGRHMPEGWWWRSYVSGTDELTWVKGGWPVADGVVQCRPAPDLEPRTERVPDTEAFHKRRKVRRGEDTDVIDRLVRFVDSDGAPAGAVVQDAKGQWLADVDDDGMVEVLIEDDQ